MKIKRKKRIENNPNIEVSYSKGYRGLDNETYIEILPYDRQLNIDYVLYWIKKIHKTYTNFVIRIDGYSIDGLSETNNNLLFNGSILYDTYTEEYRTLKI
tara:strand:+ start:69 stop:368 length:300 start_codon:yes stop_codon:yes gene_type:complete